MSIALQYVAWIAGIAGAVWVLRSEARRRRIGDALGWALTATMLFIVIGGTFGAIALDAVSSLW